VRTTRIPAFPLVVATVALVALFGMHTVSLTRALAIWIVVLTAVVLFGLVRTIRDSDGAPRARRFEAALRNRPAPSSPPVELLRTERELELGIASALYAHRRLLPLLRAAAAARIGIRHGLDLERRPDAARALLGDDVWELLRPDRPAPEDRHGPGVPRTRIVAVIERLESL
jgi:hypothetical protein